MFKKSAIAAATIAAALVAFQPAANAGDNDGHFKFGFSKGHTYGHSHGFRHDKGFRKGNFSKNRFMSRSKLFRSLKNRGYYDFHDTFRRGAFYKTFAFRDGKIFKLTVDGRNGRILKRRRAG